MVKTYWTTQKSKGKLKMIGTYLVLLQILKNPYNTEELILKTIKSYTLKLRNSSMLSKQLFIKNL